MAIAKKRSFQNFLKKYAPTHLIDKLLFKNKKPKLCSMPQNCKISPALILLSPQLSLHLHLLRCTDFSLSLSPSLSQPFRCISQTLSFLMLSLSVVDSVSRNLHHLRCFLVSIVVVSQSINFLFSPLHTNTNVSSIFVNNFFWNFENFRI